MLVDAGVGYLLVAIHIRNDLGDVRQLYNRQQLYLLLLLVLLVDLVEDGLHLGDVGDACLVFVLRFELLDHQFLDVLGLVVD